MDDGPDVGTVVLILTGLVGVLIFAFIGRLIGQKRGQSEGGAAMGALLGPVGLVGAAFLPDKRRQCPACKGRVPDDARKCMHCGEDLPVQSAPAPPAPAAVVPPSFDYDPFSVRTIPTPAPRPPEPEMTAADLSIACPLCGERLAVSSVKRGENYCPHCSEKFIAE
ncbi:MAG: hypothetical protein WAO21_12085 [Verrucomicrobiia bacterium]|jgi:hypothetical protein